MPVGTNTGLLIPAKIDHAYDHIIIAQGMEIVINHVSAGFNMEKVLLSLLKHCPNMISMHALLLLTIVGKYWKSVRKRAK